MLLLDFLSLILGIGVERGHIAIKGIQQDVAGGRCGRRGSAAAMFDDGCHRVFRFVEGGEADEEAMVTPVPGQLVVPG